VLRIAPSGEPVSAVTTSSTNASTFASITPASPVDRQPPFVSALANLSANFPSMLALHATRRPGLMTSFDQHLSLRSVFFPVSRILLEAHSCAGVAPAPATPVAATRAKTPSTAGAHTCIMALSSRFEGQ